MFFKNEIARQWNEDTVNVISDCLKLFFVEISKVVSLPKFVVSVASRSLTNQVSHLACQVDSVNIYYVSSICRVLETLGKAANAEGRILVIEKIISCTRRRV